MKTAHRRYPIPPDAPALCSDLIRQPAQYDRPRLSTRAAQARWTRIAHRRARRVVRRLFGAARPLRWMGPAWSAKWAVGDALCARSQCRYQMADLYAGKLLRAGCAMRLANGGASTQDDIAHAIGTSRQHVDQVEGAALVRLREAMNRPRGVTPTMLVREALARLGRTVPMDLVRETRLARHEVAAALDELIRAKLAHRRYRRSGDDASAFYWLVGVDGAPLRAVGSPHVPGEPARTVQVVHDR